MQELGQKLARAAESQGDLSSREEESCKKPSDSVPFAVTASGDQWVFLKREISLLNKEGKRLKSKLANFSTGMHELLTKT